MEHHVISDPHGKEEFTPAAPEIVIELSNAVENYLDAVGIYRYSSSDTEHSRTLQFEGEFIDSITEAYLLTLQTLAVNISIDSEAKTITFGLTAA
jgi:hypothetical protein